MANKDYCIRVTAVATTTALAVATTTALATTTQPTTPRPTTTAAPTTPYPTCPAPPVQIVHELEYCVSKVKILSSLFQFPYAIAPFL